MAIFTVLRSGKDGRYGFKNWHVLVRLIWFCEMAKLGKFVLSSFKRIT